MIGINTVYSPYITKIGFQSKKNDMQKFSLKNENLEELKRQQLVLKGEKPDTGIDMPKIAGELVNYINGENPEEAITIGNCKVPLTNDLKLYEQLMEKEKGKGKNPYIQIQALVSVYSFVSGDAENFINNNLHMNNYNRDTKERIKRIETLNDVQLSLVQAMNDDIYANRTKRVKKKH
jgi:hypothetical protein